MFWFQTIFLLSRLHLMIGTTDFHQRITVKKAVSTHRLLIKCRMFNKMTWTPAHTWTSSSFRMGMDRTLYFCLSSLERGEDIIFLRMWEGALKCLFRFLLRSEVTKGLNFILAAGASAMATEGKSHRSTLNITLFFLNITLNSCVSMSSKYSDLVPPRSRVN